MIWPVAAGDHQAAPDGAGIFARRGSINRALLTELESSRSAGFYKQVAPLELALPPRSNGLTQNTPPTPPNATVRAAPAGRAVHSSPGGTTCL